MRSPHAAQRNAGSILMRSAYSRERARARMGEQLLESGQDHLKFKQYDISFMLMMRTKDPNRDR